MEKKSQDCGFRGNRKEWAYRGGGEEWVMGERKEVWGELAIDG